MTPREAKKEVKVSAEKAPSTKVADVKQVSPDTASRGRMRVREGVVVSDKMNKTRVIAVTRLYSHRLYKKVVKEVTNIYAHDEKNESKTGDRVRVVETRPLSKTKRYKILEVMKK